MRQASAVGHRLALARTQLGLTQQEVAARLGVARTTLAEMETGQRKVTADELYRLADILLRPLDYFFSPVLAQSVFALRSDAEELPAPAREALVHLDNRLAELRSLEAFSGIRLRARLRVHNLTDWRNLDVAAKNIAHSERQRLGLASGPVCNIREVLEERAGILAFGYYVPAGAFCGAFATDGERAALLVNVAHLAGRVSFTLAHEYAHALTAEHGVHVELRRQQDRGREHFANRFADNLLMPQDVVEEALDRFGVSPQDISVDQVLFLASYVGVSFTAVLRRLEHFSIVSREAADKLRKSAKPVKRARELGLPDLRQEFSALPPTYRHMVFSAFHRRAISASRLSEFLGTEVDEAYRAYAAWAQAAAAGMLQGEGIGVAAT